MAELQLTQTPGDRRVYALQSVGTLRLKGLSTRAATAEAGGLSWEFGRRGIFRTVIEAADAAGNIVGEFKNLALRRGGLLRWSDRELELRPDSFWRQRYALIVSERLILLS